MGLAHALEDLGPPDEESPLHGSAAGDASLGKAQLDSSIPLFGGPSFVADLTIYGSAVFVRLVRQTSTTLGTERPRVRPRLACFVLPRRSQFLCFFFVPPDLLMYRSSRFCTGVGAVKWEGFSQRALL